jgi:hypothetical protein
MYATMRHSVTLNNGERAGLLLGDGAGIGKGRQIAGLIYDSYIRGIRRHVWFSSSGDLADDAKRDFADIGASSLPIFSLGKSKSQIPLWKQGYVSASTVDRLR